MGLKLTFAIALHNIPEGLAIAYATACPTAWPKRTGPPPAR